VAKQALATQGIVAERVLVTATPLNTVLRRVVAVTPDGFHEGFHSLLDREPGIRFERFDRGVALRDPVARIPAVREVATFTHGFYQLSRRDARVLVSDLRMGQHPSDAFEFAVAEYQDGRLVPLAVPEKVHSIVVDGGRRWLLSRALGAPAAPPG